MFPGHTYQDRYKVNEDGSLHIKEVVRKDEGHYVCSAISQVGATTTTVFLQVHLTFFNIQFYFFFCTQSIN